MFKLLHCKRIVVFTFILFLMYYFIRYIIILGLTYIILHNKYNIINEIE